MVYLAGAIYSGFNRRLTQITQILRASLRILTKAVLSCAAMIAADLTAGGRDSRRLAARYFQLDSVGTPLAPPSVPPLSGARNVRRPDGVFGCAMNVLVSRKGRKIRANERRAKLA